MNNKQKKTDHVSESYPVAYAVELGSMYVQCPDEELVRARRGLNFERQLDDGDHVTGTLQTKPPSPSPSNLVAEAVVVS